MSKCPKCDGIGIVDNDRYWRLGGTRAYEQGIEARIKCRKCKGLGYLVTEMRDVIGELQQIEVGLREKYPLNSFSKRIENILEIIKNNP